MSKTHREYVIDYIKANDIRAIQGAPVTEDMIRDNWRKVVTPQSDISFVSPDQLDARAKHRRDVEVLQVQRHQMEEQRRYEAMTDDERGLSALDLHIQAVEATIVNARRNRQWAKVEMRELQLEQLKAEAVEQKARIARLAERRTTDLALQADPDFAYALTSAEVNRDILDLGSVDAIENSVFIDSLKSATQENFKSVVADFHAWEAKRYARLREEKQAAEIEALQKAAPAIDAMHKAAQEAAAAGLKSAEAAARSQGHGVPATQPTQPAPGPIFPQPLDAGVQAAKQDLFNNHGQAT